jgi:hypothetical protein
MIWDVSNLLLSAKVPEDKLGPDALSKCWDELANTDAMLAYEVIGELAQRPEQTVALLADRLSKNPVVDSKQMTRLLADLDDKDFKVRRKASADLGNLGGLAEAALKKALENNPSAEVKHSATDLLEKLQGGAESPERLRLLRVTEVLERMGTAEARRLLEKMANDGVEDDILRESKASLARLAKVPKQKQP